MKAKMNVVKKVLGFVLTLVMVCGMLPMTSNAATPSKLYLQPNSNWKSDGARFAAYFFGNGDTWVSMTDENADGVYEVIVPEGYPSVIFCRMNPGDENNSWDTKWNQTGDLTITTDGCLYTVAADTWDKGGGTWSHAYTDGVCTLCGAYEDGVGAKLAGYSLSVDGKIGVNFYMELDSAVVADAAAKMQFTLPDGSTSDVLVSAATQETVAEKTYYVFTCEVAAKEMASNIKAKIVTSTGEGTEYTYTVRDYADALLARSTSDTEKAFVRAMLNYGAYAQQYFGYNTSDLANKNLSELEISTAIPANLNLSAYAATGTKAATDDYLGSYVANLILESTTTFNIRVTPNAGVTISSINDVAEASLTKDGNAYVVSFGEINASQLDDVCTLVVKDAASNTATLTFYPLTYCERVLATSDDANLKNVVSALYMYNEAANAYVGQ